MERREGLLEHWKYIVRAVLAADAALRRQGHTVDEKADPVKEADRWCELVAREILKTNLYN